MVVAAVGLSGQLSIFIVFTILLVDDEPAILGAFQLLLEGEGYRVVTALNGETALAVAAAERPNLIITDWMMPRIDGVELCRRLRKDAQFAAVPIVMVSAASPPAQPGTLWNAFLHKPPEINRLVKLIRAFLTQG
jgi:DNA-binding response OmpR family regulator